MIENGKKYQKRSKLHYFIIILLKCSIQALAKCALAQFGIILSEVTRFAIMTWIKINGEIILQFGRFQSESEPDIGLTVKLWPLVKNLG